MMGRPWLAICTGVLCACALVDAPPETRFASETGFTALYPSDWIRVGADNGLGPTSARLDIVSPGERVQGVVIGDGQAEIKVMREGYGEFGIEIADILALRIRDEEILSSRNMPTPSASDAQCDAPTEVVSRAEVGPGAYTIHTHLICRVGGSRFLTWLIHWEGESRAEQFRQTALAVARSIRASGPDD